MTDEKREYICQLSGDIAAMLIIIGIIIFILLILTLDTTYVVLGAIDIVLESIAMGIHIQTLKSNGNKMRF